MKRIDTNKIEVSLPTTDGGKVVLVGMNGAPKSVPIDKVYRNVYRLDSSGSIIWQIGKDNPFPCFTNIYYDNVGRLMGYNFDGGEYIINLDTGNVTPNVLLK